MLMYGVTFTLFFFSRRKKLKDTYQQTWNTFDFYSYHRSPYLLIGAYEEKKPVSGSGVVQLCMIKLGEKWQKWWGGRDYGWLFPPPCSPAPQAGQISASLHMTIHTTQKINEIRIVSRSFWQVFPSDINRFCTVRDWATLKYNLSSKHLWKF